MKDPGVVIGLSDTNDRDSLVVKRSDGEGVLHYVAWDLSEVENEGYMAFCQRVGNAAVRMLAASHESTFRNYPLIMPPKPIEEDVGAMVMHLIRMTHLQRTKVYVTAIDELIKRNPAEFGNSTIADSWSTLRINALTFPE